MVKPESLKIPVTLSSELWSLEHVGGKVEIQPSGANALTSHIAYS